MYHLNLPETTWCNRAIKKEYFFTRTITSPLLRKIYDEQIKMATWRNKLSRDTMRVIADGAFSELQVFDIALTSRSLDKRLLFQIDRCVPYYVFHILNYSGKYRAWIASKREDNDGKIRVKNYQCTSWLDDRGLDFSFEGATIGDIYFSLRNQVEAKRKEKTENPERRKERLDFMKYCQTTKMARSYKPTLILATLRAGGSITVEQAAAFFVKFYQERKAAGLKPEAGPCVYADEPDNWRAVRDNLIRNPVNALLHSGFFEYDEENEVFSFTNDIYDALTIEEIDEISDLCDYRLQRYFKNMT